ncbi:MAG: MarP family serine protease [Solirubrobacteraceae bacterium]
MNWIDLVIVLVLAGAALHGWQRGAALQVLALAGFWLGLLVGVLIAPPLARLVSGSARAIVVIAVLLGCAVALGIAGELLGLRLSGFLARLHLGALDGALGVAASLIGTLLVVWLIGNVLAASRTLGLDRALAQSRIVRTLNRALPDIPTVFAQIESYLSERGLPIVFVNVPSELLPPAKVPADPAVRAAMAAAGNSTVKVTGPACSLVLQGSGFVAAPHLVVTNAHVVAGDRHPRVIDRAGVHAATPVLFDPRLDLAVLRVPGLEDRPLSIDPGLVARSTTGAALGYPENGGLHATAAAVNGLFAATGLDIYGRALVTREVYALNARIEAGNSGGPLVSTGTATLARGTVIGVVFARSTTEPGVGYALTTPDVESALRKAQRVGTAVSTGSCLR